MRAEETTMQQSSDQQAATRADVAARVRDAVERARQAENAARDASRQVQRDVRQAQLDARAGAREAQAAEQAAQADAQAARAGLRMPPAPERIVVQDGHVVVTTDNGQVTRVVTTPGGRTMQMPQDFPRDIPPGVQNVAYSFFLTMAIIAIGIPLARAFGRWVDRRGARAPAVPADVTARLERIEQAVETVAVEVERISEGQRFTSRLMAELRQAPQLEGARADGVRIDGTRIPEPRR